jgi:UrcA family protein
MTANFKIAFAALATSLVFAPAATAQARVQTTSISVFYDDLDMSKPAGGAALLKRIESAARRVCGLHAHFPLPLELAPKIDECRRDAVANAVRSADHGMLTLAWSGKYPAIDMALR